MYELDVSPHENIKYIRRFFNITALSYGVEVYGVKEEISSWLTDFSMNVIVVRVHGQCWEKHNILDRNIDYESTQSLIAFAEKEEGHRSFMITKFLFYSEEDRTLFKLTWG